MTTLPIPFDELVAAAQACRRCPAMEGRRRVLSRANGAPGARIMFIAEAPGRRGGDVTGVPLTRDQSGRRFTHLLGIAGLRRDEVFITNAVLCNPRRVDGANRPPSASELRTCSCWLAAQIEAVSPAVVVTLGATGLRALALLEPHRYTLRSHIAMPVPWAGRVLVPLYHPSPRAGLSRSYADQERDFRALARIIRALNLTKANDTPRRNAPTTPAERLPNIEGHGAPAGRVPR